MSSFGFTPPLFAVSLTTFVFVLFFCMCGRRSEEDSDGYSSIGWPDEATFTDVSWKIEPRTAAHFRSNTYIAVSYTHLDVYKRQG